MRGIEEMDVCLIYSFIHVYSEALMDVVYMNDGVWVVARWKGF